MGITLPKYTQLILFQLTYVTIRILCLFKTAEIDCNSKQLSKWQQVRSKVGNINVHSALNAWGILDGWGYIHYCGLTENQLRFGSA